MSDTEYPIVRLVKVDADGNKKMVVPMVHVDSIIGLNKVKGIPGPSGPNGKQGPEGPSGKSAYDYAIDGGFVGTEQDFIRLLSYKIPAPSGYMFDTSSVPWKIKFNNGSVMTMPSYGNNAGVYGYGASQRNPYSSTLSSLNVTATIMQIIVGGITLETLSDATNLKTNVFTYFNKTTVVENKVNDGDGYNWENAKLSGLYADEKNGLRILFEIGVLSEEQVLKFGATKKEGN